MSDAWDFSCPDWAERLKRGQSIVPRLPLDMNEADRAVAIFDKLRLPDVPGQPSLGVAAGDWFRAIVRAIFGSLDDEGARRVGELFLMVPKKNAKTSNGAALSLVAMLMNRRPRAQMIYVGPTQEVADLAFQQASGMIDADPDGYLQKRFHVQDHLKQIVDRRNKASLKVKTFDMKVVTGSKPVFVLLDELHVMSMMSQASRVLTQIRGGMIANPEAVLVIITTQSDRAPAGVFQSELRYARAVRDGKVAEGATVLPVIYEFPEDIQRSKDKEWRDPAIWPMVQPNLGRSISLAKLRTGYAQAVEKGPEEERSWASQHLNVEIGIALHANRWAGAEFWERQADKTITLEAMLERCEVIVVGLDGGGLDDLYGFCAVGRDTETREWLSWGRAWCHKGVLERRKQIAPRLLDFQKEGTLTIVDDALEDIQQMVEIIGMIDDAGLLAQVAVDPAGLGEMIEALAEIDITPENGKVIGAPQGYALMNAIKTSERKLASSTLLHDGSALMAWSVGNLKIEPTATAIRASKQSAGDAKIDPVIAMFNAVTVMSRNPEAQGRSVYEDDDFIV